jgi:predicted SprT family Zn-dependent metalloprotease
LTPTKETPAALRRAAPTPSWTQQKRGLRLLAPQLFREYNQLVFANQLPLELQVVWNPKLQRTAGYCAFITRGGKREARIELSEKVLDSEDRLRKTLAHEMCHAAQWLVDGVSKPPHGAAFWRWAKIFTRHVPEMEVTTCHSYEIYYKFRYVCSSCANTFGRQTKSVDLTRQCCARCKGKLQLLGAFNRDGAQIKERGLTPFAQFVKANFGPLKKARPGESHKELMAELGQRWKDGKGGDGENLSENLERALRL